MPTYQHEVPLQMIRQRPDLAVEILRDAAGIAVPTHDQVVHASENVNTLHAAERTCDGALLAKQGDKTVYGIVVESQRQTDTTKEHAWPSYLATFRHQHRCDADLLVICLDEVTARKVAAPITLGLSGSVIYPVAVSPKDLPPVTDPERARTRPDLAVFTAPAHADGPHGKDVLRAYCEALEVLSREDGKLYHDYAASLFSDVASTLLEEIVKIDDYVWQSDFAIKHRSQGKAEGKAEGKVEGEAKALLTVLRARKLCVSDQVRQRIMDCTDLDQLDRWLERATTVDTADQLFD